MVVESLVSYIVVLCPLEPYIFPVQKFSELVTRKFPGVIRFQVYPNDNARPKYTYDLFSQIPLRASPVSNFIFVRPCHYNDRSFSGIV